MSIKLILTSTFIFDWQWSVGLNDNVQVANPRCAGYFRRRCHLIIAQLVYTTEPWYTCDSMPLQFSLPQLFTVLLLHVVDLSRCGSCWFQYTCAPIIKYNYFICTHIFKLRFCLLAPRSLKWGSIIELLTNFHLSIIPVFLHIFAFVGDPLPVVFGRGIFI